MSNGGTDSQIIVERNQVWSPDFTALNYDALQAEIVGYIRSRYEEEGIQTDYLQTNAAILMTDAAAYVGHLLGNRMDDLVHEVWLQTAQLRTNALLTLRTLGQEPLLPRAARLPVVVTFEDIPNVDVIMARLYQINVTGLDGTTLQFEAMFEKGDYYSSIILPAGTKRNTVYFYEGVTYQDIFQSTGAPRQQYRLQRSPVIEDSFYVSVSPIAPDIITAEQIVASRITQVDSLVTSLDEIIYTYDVMENNEVLLRFATDEFGQIPPRGWYIYVDYRVGGGSRGNVSVGAVDTNTNLVDDAGNSVRALLANTTSGATGGANEESLEEIAERVPARVATASKLVQRSDYDSMLREILPDEIDRVYVMDYQTAIRINRANPIVPQNSVYLWVLPKNASVMSEDQRQIIATSLEELNLIAIAHYLFDPDYNDWTLQAELYVDRTVNQERAETAIREQMLAEFGQFNLENQPTGALRFNRAVRISKLIEILQKNIGATDDTGNYVVLRNPAADIDPSSSIPPRYGEITRLTNDNIFLDFILREES